MMDAAKVEADYQRIAEAAAKPGISDHARSVSKQWVNGGWKHEAWLVRELAGDVRGKVALDFGCKFGHLAPVLLAMGATKVIGVDAEEEYVAMGRALISPLFPQVEYALCRNGRIPVAPESVGVITMIEVISHVNPAVLHGIWQEFSQILSRGGVVFISDSKNRESRNIGPKLTDFYRAWERGPNGTKTCWDVVENCYAGKRREILTKEFPDADPAKLDWFAANSTGYFGAEFREAARSFLSGGTFTARPYRDGLCPTNPGDAGVVMERAFRPIHLIMDLEHYGLAGTDLGTGAAGNTRGFRYRMVTALIRRLERWARQLREQHIESPLEIVARKQW